LTFCPKPNQFTFVPRCIGIKSLEKINERVLEIAETNPRMVFFSIFGHAATLTFDRLTPKPNQFTFVPSCFTDKSLVKIHQRIP